MFLGSEDIECLRYAHENGCSWDRGTCIEAACSDDIIYLQYAHENRCPWDEGTCVAAANAGKIKCLEYALSHGCPWNYIALDEAKNNEVVQLLHKYEHLHTNNDVTDL
jgi:hypothetical protein